MADNITPKWLGHFYGGNLGFLNYEIFTIQNFAAKETKIESELNRCKWFDYRRLHHLQATYYFVRCYTEAYKDYYRKSIDSEKAPYMRCLKENDFLMAREKAAMYRLRQLVDLMGMRYDFFLRYTMDWHHKMVSDKGVVYPPRPGHLLRDEEMIADVGIAWEEHCKVSLQVASDPYFRVSNFNGCEDQLKHEAFVIEQVKNRKHQRFALSTAIYKHDAVRIEEALRQFDQSTVLAAIAEFSGAD